MKVSVSSAAYLKLSLHAGKYPHLAVNGLLLGRKEGNEVSVSDIVPLFHQHLSLAPLLEFGLLTVEQYCTQVENLRIVGLYYGGQAPEKDGVVDPLATQIASRISDNLQGSSCILAIDGTTFLSSADPHLKVLSLIFFLLKKKNCEF